MPGSNQVSTSETEELPQMWEPYRELIMKKLNIIPKWKIPPLRKRPYADYDELLEQANSLKGDQAIELKLKTESEVSSMRKAMKRRSRDLIVTSRKVKRYHYVYITKKEWAQ